MNLTTEYKAASKSKKPEIKSQIEKLTKDFNKRTGGYLDSLKFNFGNTVKITDSTPLVSQVKGPDLLFDIDKSLKPLSKFLFIYKIKFENIEFLKTPNSELMGFTILISLLLSLKRSL